MPSEHCTKYSMRMCVCVCVTQGGAPSQGRGAIHRDGDTDMPPVTGNGDREEADIVKGILSDEGTGGSHSDTGSDSRSREGKTRAAILQRLF